MAYKRIRVWDGSTWQQVGSQVPNVVQAAGTDSVILTAGTGSKGIPYGDVDFGVTPLVFVQVTGDKHATIAITADGAGFTVEAKGTGTDTINFNWFAIQANFSV